MSHFICPLCGKQSSILHYDPTDFVDDIIIIQKRGLGRGRGFDEVERYSLLDGSDLELLDLITERVARIYDLLYEDVEEEEEVEGTLEVEEEENYESLSELEKELRILEEEDEEEEDDDEEEYISDLDEEMIE